MKKAFFIDPQSYNNLAMYDYEVLSRIKDWTIYFLGNEKYSYLKFPENVEFISLFKYGRFSNNVLKAASYVWSLIKIFFLICRIKPDILHVQWVRIPKIDYWFYKAVQKFFGIKLVYTVHNILPHQIKPNDFKEYNKLYQLADILLAHTNKTRDELIKKFNINPHKIRIIPHGPLEYHFSEMTIASSAKKIADEYSLNGKIIISCLGVQSKYKGSDLLLEAWCNSPVLAQNDSFVLLLAGKVNPEITLPDLPKNVICINRRISDLEFASILSLTDVIILPYRRIEQSGVLLTAISHKIPYCATEIGELTYPLTKADVGWIIREPNINEIESTLIHILKHTEEIDEKRNNLQGWELVNKEYDWNENAEVTRACYDVLSNNKNTI